jgi:hypothetical protein
MSTSKVVALVLFIFAFLLFVVVGFDIVESHKYNLVAIGLASYVAGFILDKYVP